MPKEKKKKSQEGDEIVLNLDSFVVPLSIVLAGVIIAGAIFFTNNKSGNPVVEDTDTGNNVAQEEFPAAETTISDAPFLGDKSKARIAIVEYTDYQCSFCQRHDQETKSQLIEEYVDTGKAIYVFREFPLEFHGQLAIDSANAALCVNEISGIDKFFEFHSKIFMVADNDALTKVAQDMGIDMNKFNTCMSEERYADKIDEGLADGAKAGVQGTPGFVVGVLDEDGNVNGKLIAGAYPFESFAQIIDELLK